MVNLLIASFIIMLTSLAGKLLVWKHARDFMQKYSHFLVSVTAGVFFAVAYRMSSHTLSHADEVNTAILWILGGALGSYLLFKFIPAFHHHHDEHEEEEKHSKLDVRRIITGDAVHNVADGILLAGSFLINPVLGFVTTASVLVHEFVQEISEFFLMKQAGYSTNKALMINFAVSSTILIGAVGSFFLLERFHGLESPLLGIAAGVFFFVVFADLIPHSIQNSHKRTHYLLHIVWFFVGLFLMVGIFAISPITHGESHNDPGHENHQGHQHEE